MAKTERLIMHLDMDAFFAAVEQTHLPFLKGKPVIVGAIPGNRGVVSTCSYEARQYGVHSAMPIAKAKRLCPDGIFMEVAAEKYIDISFDLLEILLGYSPLVEQVSVDEAFVDITEVAERYGGPKALALAVKRRIWERHSLTASVGIAGVKFVAKMASAAQKPDGLTMIEPGKERDFLWPLQVEKMYGVGPKTAAALRKLGVYTIGDLAHFSRTKLKNYFGIVGELMWEMANGKGDASVSSFWDHHVEKSMGHEHTFNQDEHNVDRILGTLLYLAEKVARRLRVAGYKSRTVTLKVRRPDFKLLTRTRTISVPTDNPLVIFTLARSLLQHHGLLSSPIRLIGVSASNLVQQVIDSQDDILGSPYRKHQSIEQLLDRLRDRYGEHCICRATTQLCH